MTRVVLTTGGTGGHLFPAEALARALLPAGVDIDLVTDVRGSGFGEAMDGVSTHQVASAGVMGRGFLGKVRSALKLARGYLQARRLLAELQPGAVVGFGSYASVPTALAASRKGIPVILHEQNAVVGRANRMLAKGAVAIATSFPEVAGLQPRDARKTVLTGNPVRPAVAALGERPYPVPEPDGVLRILVVGGSLGARVFGRVVPAALAGMPPSLRERLEVAQQTRPEDMAEVQKTYAKAGIHATLATFFDDIPARLEQAHLVISRAGASTVAELACAGRPAIMVPYPHAADDHQTANAKAVERAGGGWAIPEPSFTDQALVSRLTVLFKSPQRLAEAAEAARNLAFPDAAWSLADVVAAQLGIELPDAAEGGAS